MRQWLSSLSCTLILTSGLVSCVGCTLQREPAPLGPKTTVGALGGAATGGVIGAAAGHGTPIAIAAGVLGGLLLGGGIGSALDAQDRSILQRTVQHTAAVPPGQTVTWQAPSGTRGTYTPGPVVQRADGVCRTYHMSVVIDGVFQEARGLACQNPDGTWRLE